MGQVGLLAVLLFLTLPGRLLHPKQLHGAVIAQLARSLPCFYGKGFHVNVHLPLG